MKTEDRRRKIDPRHPAASGRRAGWTPAVLAVSLGLALGACDEMTSPEKRSGPGTPSFSEVSTTVITGIHGAGELGDGSPAGDSINLQEFEFDVTEDVSGSLDYTDNAVIKSDGNPANLRAGPDVEGTAITGFVQLSSTCVEFAGVGKVTNTGELLEFRVEVCDNGKPGTGLDVFGIWVEQRFATHGSPYQRGPDMLSGGEITRETLTVSDQVITDMSGSGSLGDGEPAGDGVNRQLFDLDVGLHDGVVAGRLAYTDSAAIEADGEPARFVVEPDDTGTAFTEFTQISSTCVEAEGIGRIVNTGETAGFRVRACDNAPAEEQLDGFGIWVPEKSYQRGPDVLADGDLVKSVLTS